MDIITPRTLSGFVQLLPADQMRFNAMLDRIRATYELYGFTPLDTPVIESAEILLAKGGGETEKQIYRFTKGDADLALRFDLTVPLAKYVAENYGRLPFPFRRYQIGKVYRGERAQRGRFREFYQCDADIIGDGSLSVINEAETVSVIYAAFTSLGLTGFRIHFNNRKVLSGFFEFLGIADKSAAVMQTIDKLDKIGADKARELLVSDAGIPAETAEEICAFVTAEAPLELLERLRGKNETLDLGIAELNAVAAHLSGFGVPEQNYVIDLKIARGLDYYTGTVFETFIDGHPEIGSVCSGGRYDDLAGYYIKRKLPGVGISIGLSRLFYVLQEQGFINPELPCAPCDLLILPMTDDFSAAVGLASELRRAGIRTSIYAEDKKFRAKMSYADGIGVRYAAILGEDEIAAGQVTVRDMRSGQQTTASAALIVKGLLAALAAQKDIPPLRGI
ncbi:MAG: histidine--tRNA ligase [Oscillospiraceae bacterium]|jgi:histidyl-tRNA synthetase|nr:histidine--tRNA ligase [Oscillospiraceae bacterium]